MKKDREGVYIEMQLFVFLIIDDKYISKERLAFSVYNQQKAFA